MTEKEIGEIISLRFKELEAEFNVSVRVSGELKTVFKDVIAGS
jgi:hypothetical protein